MLLQNGLVLQYKGSEIIFEKMDIRISNQIIHEIGKLLIPELNEECIDLGGDMVLPGMTNSHYHSYTNILRGASFGEPLEIWSHDTVALGGILTNEDMRLSTTLGICEMLRSGVTACVDHLPHLKTAYTAARVYESSGFKAGLAPMLHNVADSNFLHGYNQAIKDESKSPYLSIKEYMDYYEDFIDNFHKPHKNTQVLVGVNSPQRADSELLKASADLAHKHNLSIHCHLLETRWQRLSADHSMSPLVMLDQLDMLGERTSLAHSIWLKESEIDLIAKRKAIPVSNPTSNSFMGSGIFPYEEYQKRNISIALGSDGENCGTNNNMLEILRFFILLQRTRELNYENWISLKDCYDMVTTNSNKVLNFIQASGSISSGYAADLVITDKNNFLHFLDESLANQLIFYSSLSPKHVLINGEFVMKNNVITSIDEEGLKRELVERKSYLKKSMKQSLQTSSIEKQYSKSIYDKIKYLF